jgi:hypothetical protein
MTARLANMVFILLHHEVLPEWGRDHTKLAATFEHARNWIPQLTKAKNARKRLHAEVQRFHDLVARADWKMLEIECAVPIAKHNQRVAALRKQCDLELEYDADFLGQQGIFFKNARLSEEEHAEQEWDDNDECEFDGMWHDEDDDDDEQYDDDGGWAGGAGE